VAFGNVVNNVSIIMDTVYCIDVHHLLLRFNVPIFVGCYVNSIVINRRVVMSTYIDQPSNNHHHHDSFLYNKAIKSALDL